MGLLEEIEKYMDRFDCNMLDWIYRADYYYNFSEQPWEEWFYLPVRSRFFSDENPYYNYPDWTWLPEDAFWFYKIPETSTGTSNYQLVVWSDRTVYPYSASRDVCMTIRANTYYVFTQKGDPPRWPGDVGLTKIEPPCDNYDAAIYHTSYSTRSQSVLAEAAVQADRSLSLSSIAAVGTTKELELTTVAICKGTRYLPLLSVAAIRGDTEHEFRARTDIRTNRSLELSAVAAVETEFSEEFSAVTAIGGDWDEPFSACAAIRGEGTLEFSAVAFVAVDRTEAIILEMENLWPQEYANESVPNWPSRARHWGREPLV